MKILIVYFYKPYFSKQLEKAIEKTFGMQVISAKKKFTGKARRRKGGRQLNGDDFLPFLEKIIFNRDEDFVLGITNKDIYQKGFTAIYGISAIEKKSALVSLARLKSDNRRQFFERAEKESFHEIGHLLGMGHCDKGACVMKCSESIYDCDLKLPDFCLECEKWKEKLLMKFG